MNHQGSPGLGVNPGGYWDAIGMKCMYFACKRGVIGGDRASGGILRTGMLVSPQIHMLKP